ncbi:unnamed protein product [Clonostachys chloroleuca]|uniref:Endoplasmic reticulum junction formation protein lunapark n=1 Tax=Clonostachys chloroleuca TaxID=1926264 RepID=A0AA35LY30_9HYPO|nr:unnamed protein product [Clonostachys chloroleuca]
MVSLWPWRNDSSSTASFEKTLSALSTKIKDTQSRLDRVRASSRRSKVLSTLYLAFAYLVYAIVLLLVVGHRNMGAYEWTGLAGGPVIIYGVRITLASYFSFRIDGLESRLKEYQEERTETIQKLKDATKYDSTMELIEKYGGVEGKPGQGKKKAGPADPASPNSGPEGEKQADGERKGNTPGRTSLPPPPTANIQRRPVTPNQSGNLEPTAEFAPNAEHISQSPPSPYQVYPQQYPSFQQPESHWYDRIFDVLLGEDETAPKNRIVLLCTHCRLVNGQAPPGVKSLSEIGRWRCMGCNRENGEVEDEGTRIVREVLDEQAEAIIGAGKAGQDDDGKSSIVSESDSPAASVKKRRGGRK